MGKSGMASQVDLIVGKRMALAMGLAGVTSAQIAAALGVDGATVARWLAGQQRVGPDTLCTIVRMLDQPLVFFFMDRTAGDEMTAANDSAQAVIEGAGATQH